MLSVFIFRYDVLGLTACLPSVYSVVLTSSTAQGGGGSFKNRKPIGEVGCCESGMAERSHWWTERCLRSPFFRSLSLTIYLPTSLFSMYLSICRSIYLSLSFFHSITQSIYLPIYLSISLSSVYLSSCLPVYLSISLSLFHRSICLAVYLSIYLSICLPIYGAPTYLPIYLSIYVSIYLSIYLSLSLFHLSICLAVYLSIYRSICTYLPTYHSLSFICLSV